MSSATWTRDRNLDSAWKTTQCVRIGRTGRTVTVVIVVTATDTGVARTGEDTADAKREGVSERREDIAKDATIEAETNITMATIAAATTAGTAERGE